MAGLKVPSYVSQPSLSEITIYVFLLSIQSNNHFHLHFNAFYQDLLFHLRFFLDFHLLQVPKQSTTTKLTKQKMLATKSGIDHGNAPIIINKNDENITNFFFSQSHQHRHKLFSAFLFFFFFLLYSVKQQ